MSSGTCSCGFDFKVLPGKVSLTPDSLQTKDSLVLNCPLCACPVELSLSLFKIVVLGAGVQATFRKWKRSGERPSGNFVNHGLLQLRFDRLSPIEPQELCFPAIPAFVSEDKSTRVPDLPVRPEFLECVDLVAWAKLHQSGKRAAIINGEYQAEVPLFGLEAPETVRIPLLIRRQTGGREERAFRDVNLRIWPNVNIPEWKYYLVGLAGSGPGADALLTGNWSANLRCVGGNGKWTDSLETRYRAGRALVGAVDGRPKWVSLAIGPASTNGAEQGEAMAGGLFMVPTPTGPKSQGEFQIGLDFGTSNTCVVAQSEVLPGGHEQMHLVPPCEEEQWNLYLVRGGAEEREHNGPDLWPSCVGFGDNQDLFASELLFPRPRTDTEQLAQLESIAGWRYGLEFGIPGANITPRYVEADYSVGDFKWQELLQSANPSFGRKIEHLQAKYLAAVLLNSFARMCVQYRVSPRNIEVLCSYPMSFEEGDWQTLSAAILLATNALKEQTGLEWTLRLGDDESTAAAANAGNPGAAVHVYLDMGGGSTDIAVRFERKPNNLETVYLSSVRYAGMTLLGAYAGSSQQTSCLASGATVDMLRRRVREARHINEVLGDGTLLAKRQEKVRGNRTLQFYGYLVEFVARTVAAGFLDQRFMIVNSAGEHVFPSELRVAVFLLGNGWRFYGSLAEDFTTSISGDIQKRVETLVGEEKGPYAEAILQRLAGTEMVLKGREAERGTAREGGCRHRTSQAREQRDEATGGASSQYPGLEHSD